MEVLWFVACKNICMFSEYDISGQDFIDSNDMKFFILSSKINFNNVTTLSFLMLLERYKGVGP